MDWDGSFMDITVCTLWQIDVIYYYLSVHQTVIAVLNSMVGVAVPLTFLMKVCTSMAKLHESTFGEPTGYKP